jgi:hypothetical protein
VNITVKIIKENKDGSADAMVNFDTEGLEFLVQEGILHILEAYIKQNENAKQGAKLRKKMAKKKDIDIDIDGRC